MSSMHKKLKSRSLDKDDILNKIFQSLGYDSIEDGPGLERTRNQLKVSQINQSLNQLSQKSQKKRKKVKQALSSISPKVGTQVSQQMKELQWRLQVLRQDRKQREGKNKEVITFDQLYKRQKNKYLKFRDRQKVKINDPKYLEMIGSMQIRRQKRKLQSLQKIQKNIEKLDINIKSHKDRPKHKANSEWIGQ